MTYQVTAEETYTQMDSIMSTFAPSASLDSVRQPMMQSAIVRDVPVYVCNKEITSEMRIPLMMWFIMCGTSMVNNPKQWGTWTMSVIGLLMPDFALQTVVLGHRMVEITVDMGRKAFEWRAAVKRHILAKKFSPTGSLIPGADADSTTILAGLGLDLLPAPASLLYNFLGTCQRVEAIAGYVSLVMYLAGKDIAADNRETITVRRPRAIIETYGLPAIVGCLNGPLRISDIGHTMIGLFWTSTGRFRELVFTEVAGWSRRGSSEVHDVMLITLNLMHYQRMNHAFIVARFVMAHPWISLVPEFAPAYASFRKSKDALAETPPHLRPFRKIIDGNKDVLFPRKSMEALIACAVYEEAKYNPTMGAFHTDPAYTPLVHLFERLRTEREEERRRGLT